jgi:hypothetical protein
MPLSLDLRDNRPDQTPALTYLRRAAGKRAVNHARRRRFSVAANLRSGIVLIRHKNQNGERAAVASRVRIRASVRLTILAATLALAASSVAQAAVCVRPGDELALKSKALQSELMVSALACEEAARYNAWVRRFETEIAANGVVLKRIFRQAYGTAADKRLGQFVTALANEAATRSAVEKAQFCGNTARVLDRVLVMSGAEFLEYVAGPDFAGRHDFAECGARDSAER